MFEELSEYVETKDFKLDEDTRGTIIEHFTAMEYEFSHYFPECGDIDFTLQSKLGYFASLNAIVSP